MKKNICENCNWFDEAKNENPKDLSPVGCGWCRRYPPMVTPGIGDRVWPSVRNFDWCGEWVEYLGRQNVCN